MKTLYCIISLLVAQAASAQSTLTRQLDSLTRVYEMNNYHGVILVAKGDKILYQKGYGYANFEKHIKQTPATRFKTESVGKMFTATCVMQQVERGRLKLDQTIHDLLPDLNIANANKITVHQLLTHTSGLQSPWDHPNWDFKKVYSRPELEKIFNEVPLTFQTPGERFYYSNIGYNILSWIVERVSGMTFDAYLSNNIFRPQGMKDTRHLLDTILPLSGMAQPYRIINSKKYVSQLYAISPRASGAGGWISDADDLYRFMLGLDKNRYIKASTFNIMQTANGTNPKDSSYKYYAYGLETYVNQVIAGENLYGHNGGGAGFSIDALLDPSNHYIVVSCTNLYQNSRPIAFNYMKLAQGRKPDAVKQSAAVRLYDLIDSAGIDKFIAAEKEYFKHLNIQPDVRFFGNMGEAMEAAGDFLTWEKWMTVANTYFPNNTYLTMISGDCQASLGNKEEAKRLYQSARQLASKEKNDGAIIAVDEKIKAL